MLKEVISSKDEVVMKATNEVRLFYLLLTALSIAVAKNFIIFSAGYSVSFRRDKPRQAKTTTDFLRAWSYAISWQKQRIFKSGKVS